MYCVLCNKNFASHNFLLRHYLKKTPCVKDKDKWSKNKELYIQKKIVFNEDQLKFINSSLKDMKLIGIPGGGKTRCIIEKINNHFIKEDYQTNNNFMILSFSKRCRLDFINKGKIYQKRFNRDNVKTLHSLAKTILKLLCNKDSSSLDTVIVAAKNLLDKHEPQILRDNKLFDSLKTIYLDEAQDISEIQYDFIISLKNILKCNLIMVGDPNQNIYQFQGGSDKFLLNYNVETIYLKHNYRSNQNIVDFVNSISPNQENKMISNNNSTNNLIDIYINDIESISSFILNEINSYDGNISEIAIIGPVRKSKPIYNQYLNIGLSFILNLLESNQIKYSKFFDDVNDNINIKGDDKIVIKPNHINLLTIHGSKGLEFKKVIAINFHFYTFGITPSIEDYNRFRYLWYVATSRAKDFLTLITLKSKFIWPLLENVPKNVYKINSYIQYPKLHFKEARKKFNHGITDLLNNITPKKLFKLETLVKYDVKYNQIFMTNPNKLYEHNEYSSLYGKYIESCFQYFYTKKFYNIDNNIFKKFINKIDNSILVDKKHTPILIKLINRLNYNLTDSFNLNKFIKYKNRFTTRELNTYNYIVEKLYNKNNDFTFIFQNDVIVNDTKSIRSICDLMINNYNHKDYQINIFKITLYNYQINNELGFLWSKNFNKHIETLSYYIEQIEKCVETINTKMEFSVNTSHPNLPIIGEIDILENNDTIIDIKFTKNLHFKQVLQILFYYNNLFPDWSKPKKLKIFNFYQSRIYEFEINKEITNYQILKILSEITNEKLKNCIFVYDLETTSLDVSQCLIIERYFKEYNLNFVASKGIINIKTKIEPFIETLTGITNKMITKGENPNIFHNEIKDIFNYCESPKFIAHNGSNFDHKIMLNKKLFKNIYKNQLLDSRYIIRLLYDCDNSKLEYLYQNIVTNCSIKEKHRAEADVEMLISILKELKY